MTFGPAAAARKPRREAKPRRAPKEITPVPPGSYDSAAIILLSDGRRTTGIDTLEAAKMAADRGVRIYVVGLGVAGRRGRRREGMAIYLSSTSRPCARWRA
jgi:Ca-activated chloride channel family protein